MFDRERNSTDFGAELDAHIQLEMDRLEQQFPGDQEKRAAARRDFGITPGQEHFYESKRWLCWKHFVRSVRSSMRTLVKSLGFTDAAVLIMALGIAACAPMPMFAVSAASEQEPLKRENFRNADVLYDWVSDGKGQKLRTFITRPKNVTGKVPVIFFVGWLSCDSMEYPDGETDGFGALLLRLIDQSRYATVRMNKPGVGESQGNCVKTDFNSELEGWRAAFASMSKYEFIDTDRVFVLGMSNGGGFSPLVDQGHAVRGYIAASSWGRTWYEHMIEHERRRLAAAGKTPAEVNDGVKGFSQFYDLYLNHNMTPGQVIAEHQEWKPLWYDSPEGQYGRPAAFYQQLQALNLGDVWQGITVPVLVIYGTGDTVMSRADSDAISETVNRAHPGAAENYIVERMNHLFEVDKKFYDPLVAEILKWIKTASGEGPHFSRRLGDTDTIRFANLR